jgi:hypothetical protein
VLTDHLFLPLFLSTKPKMSNQSSYEYNNNNSQQSKQRESRKKQDQDNDQPLKRSTYNIFEAYDIMSLNDSVLDSSSVHPLQSQSPYSFDLDPRQPPQNPNQGDLNTMMKDLNLSAPPMDKQRTMPYCV